MLDRVIESMQDEKFPARVLLVAVVIEIGLLVFYFQRFGEVADLFLEVGSDFSLYFIATLFTVVFVVAPIAFYYSIDRLAERKNNSLDQSFYIVGLFSLIANLAVIAGEVFITQAIFEEGSNNIFSNAPSTSATLYLSYSIAIALSATHQFISYLSYSSAAKIIRAKKNEVEASKKKPSVRKKATRSNSTAKQPEIISGVQGESFVMQKEQGQ